ITLECVPPSSYADRAVHRSHVLLLFFFSSRRRHTRSKRDWSSDVCSSDLFECEFVAVNHSIPDALAVAIRTRAGLVLHTGDFKMDQLPLDGRITDLRSFARLGEEG